MESYLIDPRICIGVVRGEDERKVMNMLTYVDVYVTGLIITGVWSYVCVRPIFIICEYRTSSFNVGFTREFQLWLPQGPSALVTNGNGKQMAVNLKGWRRERAERHQAMIYEMLKNKKFTWLCWQKSYFFVPETWLIETKGLSLMFFIICLYDIATQDATTNGHLSKLTWQSLWFLSICSTILTVAVIPE